MHANATQVLTGNAIRKGCESLLLGRLSTPKRPVGFAPCSASIRTGNDLLTYAGDAHMITLAPTRSGKGVGSVIPNLLTYPGPVVVVDPKAEAYFVTARRRRELGHRVIKLDPFGVVGPETDSLNAMDILGLCGADFESDCQVLGDILATPLGSTKEPFWDIYGRAIHSGLIAIAASNDNVIERTLNAVIDRLQNDDVVYNWALHLDKAGDSVNKMARNEIAGVLAMPEITRGGVIATAQSYIKALMSPAVQRTLQASSFSLQDVVDGKPLSIYLIIPPDRMQSHRALLKLWIGTLMKVILSRRSRPALKTLLIIDEAAQLGNFPLLETLVTLAAGYGVWVHTIWQDLSQLQSNFPLTWKTILNNCGVIQTFGIHNRDMARQWSDYLEHSTDALSALAPDEQILAIHGQEELKCRKLNYLRDPEFRGLFDPNRFYGDPRSR
jgi:type IV secretion system protein VirD4